MKLIKPRETQGTALPQSLRTSLPMSFLIALFFVAMASSVITATQAKKEVVETSRIQPKLLSRSKRHVGCIDTTTSDGNLCINAECPFFSLGACNGGLCVCVPKGTNMATLRLVCYQSCYDSCTHQCPGQAAAAMLRNPAQECTARCDELCYKN
ncbi:uncharacterized protein LOC144149559 [Haemaphysalis longicornis]